MLPKLQLLPDFYINIDNPKTLHLQFTNRDLHVSLTRQKKMTEIWLNLEDRAPHPRECMLLTEFNLVVRRLRLVSCIIKVPVLIYSARFLSISCVRYRDDNISDTLHPIQGDFYQFFLEVQNLRRHDVIEKNLATNNKTFRSKQKKVWTAFFYLLACVPFPLHQDKTTSYCQKFPDMLTSTRVKKLYKVRQDVSIQFVRIKVWANWRGAHFVI